MPEPKIQRIRDPVHNLIELDEGDGFEGMLWRVIKTAPFQRLRRIRQLGFSDLVYPGATHSRFIHSLGVFHTARRLMRIVDRYVSGLPQAKVQAEAAIAAALLHDVGHGPFSHAFEPIGKKFEWKLLGKHENHSEAIIRDGEIGAQLNGYRPGFADVVSAVVRGGPETVYRAVVSSQFDADRLDYVQRDRLMAGTRLGSVDFEWLIANLEIQELPADPNGIRRKTFVLGPKAIYAAEAFVTGLFQMYPTVYLHKTTRGAEKIAQKMLERIAELVVNGDILATGLPENHPLILAFKNPESLALLSALDDTVILGALSLLNQSTDPLVRDFAERLRTRNLFKAIELNPFLLEGAEDSEPDEEEKRYLRRMTQISETIAEWSNPQGRSGRILLDSATRKPYKHVDEDGPINQIWIREGQELLDLRNCSKAVAATKTYKAFRAYVAAEDQEANEAVLKIARDAVEGDKHV